MAGSGKKLWKTGGERFLGAPVSFWLLVLNVALFLIDRLGLEDRDWGRLTPYGLFSCGEHFYVGGVFHDTLGSFELWRLIGFQFLHHDLAHLIFNMLAIFMFGGIVERLLGSGRFLLYYLICGVGGALFYALLVQFGWLGENVLVGASAGIFGILVALIVAAPNLLVRPILMSEPITMRTMGIIVLGIGAYTVLTVGENAGGEAGHLGGAIVGYVLMKWFELQGNRKRGGSFKRGAVLRNPNYVAKIRPRSVINLDSSEVDRILDKVNSQGLHSLTDEERKFLKDLSDKE